jgi:homoaconitase/3-isopropylmalate dehydratase large subunit
MERGALATPPIALPETPTTTRTPLSREGSSEGSVLRRRSSLGKEQAEAAMAAAAAVTGRLTDVRKLTGAKP